MWCRPQLWVIVVYTLGYQFFRFAEVSTSGVTWPSDTDNVFSGTIGLSERVSSSLSHSNKPTYRAKSIPKRQMPEQVSGGTQNDSFQSFKTLRLRASQSQQTREISKAMSSQGSTINSLKSPRRNNTFNFRSDQPVVTQAHANSTIYYPRTTDETEGDEARTGILIMTTVGIINGIIASTAALGMGGVVVSGLLLLIKLMLKAMIIMVGWVYII